MNKLRYIGIRTVQTVVLLFLIMTFLFFFFRLMPGEVTDLMVREGASEEAIAAFRSKWGLDEPLYIQYWRYLVNLSHLDLGTSLLYQIPVWEYTRMKIFNSFILVAPGITTGYIIGSIWGAVIGNVGNNKLEEYGIGLAVFVGTFPIFFLGLVAIIIFSLQLGWFPTGSMISVEVSNKFADAPWWRAYLTKDFLIHYALPFAVIALRYSSQPALLMRTSIDEVQGQGFSYYHRITGLPKHRRIKHLIKHASLPVLTFYPLSLSRAVGGLVLIEFVFNWPGIGSALVRAVFSRDFPVIQFIFILVATFIVIGNFLVDILYGVIDPRVSVSSE